MQSITILGSTGSIGLSTLDVVSRHPDDYQIYALTANSSAGLMYSQIERYQPQFAVMADEQSAQVLAAKVASAGLSTEVLTGAQSLADVSREADIVMAAIVGAAGLLPTLAAVKAGRRVLLANKEALVMAGALFMEAVAQSGAILLPIDSEHNAIFQCLPPFDTSGLSPLGVRRVLLTGSGGPFRSRSRDSLKAVTPDEACAHPNWSMGRKISVDSATMMNKGLELIEACWLFHTPADNIDILVHPQSVIHSMVEYCDGSVIAQLGNPDMRTPIAHALAWPQRIDSGVSSLDLIAQGRLDFEAPDSDKFPALRLARSAAERGGSASTILNAANEIAVAAFLDGRLAFLAIVDVIEQVISTMNIVEPQSLGDVQDADAEARRRAAEYIASR